MLTASEAKTKWDAICMQCKADIEGWGVWPAPAPQDPADWSLTPGVSMPASIDYGPNMLACILQLGIPLFKEQASKADRDVLQQAALLPGADIQAAGSFCADPEVIGMARAAADQQSPTVDAAPAPVAVPMPSATTAATAAASKAAAAGGVLPIVAIAAGVGVLWWLLKGKRKS